MSYHTFESNHRQSLLLAPAARGSTNTSWTDVFGDGNGAQNGVFELVVGTVTGDVTWKLTQATSSGGAGAKDITGAAGTTITTANDNAIKTIELNAGALDTANSFRYVRAEVTVASGTPPWSVKLIQHRLRRPGDFTQDATYDNAVEVVN